MNEVDAMLAAAGSLKRWWPSATPETLIEFMRLGRGLGVNDAGKYIAVQANFYHNVQYPAAGTTSLTFFNTNASLGIANLNGNSLPPERPMWITGFRCTFLDANIAAGVIQPIEVANANERPFVDAGDGALAAVDTLISGAGSPLLRTRQKMNVGQLACMKVVLADMPVLDLQGLERIPTGGGYDVQGNIAYGGGITAGAATQAAATFANLNNGAAFYANQNVLRNPIPWLPQQQIAVTLNWPTALPVTASASGVGGFVIKLEITGELLMSRQG